MAATPASAAAESHAGTSPLKRCRDDLEAAAGEETAESLSEGGPAKELEQMEPAPSPKRQRQQAAAPACAPKKRKGQAKQPAEAMQQQRLKF